MLDISGGGAEIGMTGQHLDIAKGAACLADLPGRTGDEGSATGMARTADHPQAGIKPVEPDGDRARRQTVVTFAVYDRPIWTGLDPSFFMESHER
jgi:hypothetical protein